MTRSKTFRAVALALAIGMPSAAFALTPEQEKILERDCSGDYLRFCGQYDPGSKQVEQCFQQRMAQLSPACRGSIQAVSKAGGRR